MPTQQRKIPLYTCDGEILQSIDSHRLERLTDLGRLSRVVRNRAGYVMRAYLRRMPDEPKPSTLRDYLGTRYSFQQRLENGLRCHRLRSLGDNPFAERELAPAEVRPIFIRVLLDCLTMGAAAHV